MSTIRLSVSIRSNLITFFLLAYLLSWSIWIPAALASHGVLGYAVPANLNTQESLLIVLLYHASTAFTGLIIPSTSTIPLISLVLNLIFVTLIITVSEPGHFTRTPALTQTQTATQHEGY